MVTRKRQAPSAARKRKAGPARGETIHDRIRQVRLSEGLNQGEFALALAKAESVPCQVKQAVAGGNDAGAIHTTKSGVRTIAVSLPCRYLHGPVGLIAQSDFHHAETLILSLANKIAGSSET